MAAEDVELTESEVESDDSEVERVEDGVLGDEEVDVSYLAQGFNLIVGFLVACCERW